MKNLIPADEEEGTRGHNSSPALRPGTAAPANSSSNNNGFGGAQLLSPLGDTGNDGGDPFADAESILNVKQKADPEVVG